MSVHPSELPEERHCGMHIAKLRSASAGVLEDDLITPATNAMITHKLVAHPNQHLDSRQTAQFIYLCTLSLSASDVDSRCRSLKECPNASPREGADLTGEPFIDALAFLLDSPERPLRAVAWIDFHRPSNTALMQLRAGGRITFTDGLFNPELGQLRFLRVQPAFLSRVAQIESLRNAA